MFINGIGLGGFRSFGDELQLIAPFRKINLFIGQNNSGKSNVLTFLAKHYAGAVSSAKSGNLGLDMQPIDRPIGAKTDRLQFSFPIKIDDHTRSELLTRNNNQPTDRQQIALDRIVRSEVLTKGTEFLWLTYESVWSSQTQILSLLPGIQADLVNENVVSDLEWQMVWTALTGKGRGSRDKHWIPEILKELSLLIPDPPSISIIPAIRQVGRSRDNNPEDLSGIGLIDRLAKLQNPNYDQQHLRDDFENINEFVRTVVGNSTARLEIPFERDAILVHLDEKVLPLSSLGTGIHEVIILAAAATVLRETVICIEEPEIHLHPTLQKKLIRYLCDKTDNQYFIATHSAHLLDTPGAGIFHVRYENGQSRVEFVSTDSAKSRICMDLGYRASDLLQANCIIWVEGPSDRIYLNHWIRDVDPGLIEGLHYSIMFYGGRLLNHLSADEPEVEEFISLRRLNRHIAILIDSDRPRPRAPINKTKRRIRDEFNKGPGFAWITKGREIENYVEHSLLEQAIKKAHPRAKKVKQAEPFDKCLSYVTVDGQTVDAVDKIKVAHEVARLPANLDYLDLRQQIVKLVRFIRDSNDFGDQ